MTAGRPTDYTEELAAEVLARIAEGRSLRSIGADKDMPCERTIYRWLKDNNSFCQQYARAREAQSDVYADELVKIADECAIDPAAVAKARLQSDNRKWIASKLKPKKYGDRAALELSGDQEKPINYNITVEFVRPTPQAEGK